MTRRDFDFIAYQLRVSHPWFCVGFDEANDETKSMMMFQWQRTVDKFATALTNVNPRFNVEQFYKATGYIRKYDDTMYDINGK